MSLNTPPPSALKETIILYKARHPDEHTITHTDGRIDRLFLVYPRKHSFCGGTINNLFNLFWIINSYSVSTKCSDDTLYLYLEDQLVILSVQTV